MSDTGSILISQMFLTALLTAMVTSAIPLLLAGLGEQLSQRAGVLNIGLEGMMLMGAYTGFFVALMCDNLWLGFGAGVVGGVLVALLMVIFVLYGGLNQIVIGIALLLGVEGLTAILHYVTFAKTYPRLPAADVWSIPGLAQIPIIGTAIFSRSPVAYGAIMLVAIMAWIDRRTHLGLSFRAAGEKPSALDGAGVDVIRIRSIAVLCTGAFAGLGGAYMALVGAGIFVPFMTNGAGFIGIVLAMLARGRPLLVLLGSLLFGACLSITTVLQLARINAPTDIVQMLPFAAVLIVLTLFGSRGTLPSALGENWQRGNPLHNG